MSDLPVWSSAEASEFDGWVEKLKSKAVLTEDECRALCEKGRASTSDGLFARLFPSDGAAPASDEENADAAAPPRLD